MPEHRGPSVADRIVRCSASRPGQVVPVQDRERCRRCQTRPSRAGQPSRWSCSSDRAASARPLAASSPRGRRRSRRRSRPARRPAAGASSGSLRSVDATAASPPHGSRRRNTPPDSTTRSDVAPVRRSARREVPPHGDDRGQRRDPAVLRRAARVAGARSRPRWSSGRPSARAGRPPPGRRRPRPAPRPAPRPRPRARRGRLPRCARPRPSAAEWTSVVAQPTSTTSTRPPRIRASSTAPCPTASGVATRTSRRNRGPTAGPRPPSTCRR